MQEGKESSGDDRLIWEEFKRKKLESLEKAKALGEVDEGIIPLLELINEKKEFVTSSSCYGRILLLSGWKKGEAKHFAKWHYLPRLEEIKEKVESFQGEMLWLKVEPFILHVFAKNREDALRFMQEMMKAGVKRGGIKHCNPFCFIEIQGTSYLAFPISICHCKWEDLYHILRKMMEDNERRLKKIEEAIRSL